MATYVLVHGAYQGGWIWKLVAARLRAAGHTVHAPTLDGCAERHDAVRAGITNTTHGKEIAQLLFFEDLEQVVLVGKLRRHGDRRQPAGHDHRRPLRRRAGPVARSNGKIERRPANRLEKRPGRGAPMPKALFAVLAPDAGVFLAIPHP
jgi:hypothetical protein